MAEIIQIVPVSYTHLTKGVNVYLTTTKAGYAGSVVINYTISPLDLTAENVSNYLEATFVTTSKPYTGTDIVLPITKSERCV